MEYHVKNINKKMLNDNFSSYVLGVDIGGTNTNIGVAGIKNAKPFLFYRVYKVAVLSNGDNK